MATALSFPTISGVTTPPYLSALSETANIQNTINFLYYGSADSGTTPRTSLSTSSGIYGMLSQLQNQISAVSSGINVHENCKYASVSAFTVTYNNGTLGVGATLTNAGTQAIFAIDGYTAVSGDVNNLRVLIKDQATATQNGIYVLTTIGSAYTNWVLTRAEDSNNSIVGEVAEGDFTFISDGTSNNKAYILTSPSATNPSGPAGTILIGTDSINWQQFIGVGSYYIGTTQAQITTAPATGSPLAGLSTIGIQGGTSGTITLNTVAVAGTNTITLPAITGTALITSGTTATAGYFDTGSTVPSGTTRLNYGGYLYSTRFYTDNIYTITGATATPNLFPDVTTGTVTIGDGVTTGTIKIGGTSAGAKTITIGTSTGSTTINGTVINSGDSVIQKSASFTVAAGEKNYHITGSSATVTVTLPTATAGRTLNFVNKSAAFQVVASASVVMPRIGTQSLGTLICSATVGSFATLVADGTNWYVMAGA